MDALEQLARRVQQAAEEILSLKKERGQLLSELELMKEQLRGQKIAARETEGFEREKARIRSKLEKLRGKIEKLLKNESAPEMPMPQTVLPSPATARRAVASVASTLGDLFDEKLS